MSALTRSPATFAYGTVGTATAGTVALTSNASRNFLQVQNTHATQNLAYTLDGTSPVINGQGFTLGPLGSATYDVFCPTGAVTVIGSAAGTNYTVMWA